MNQTSSFIIQSFLYFVWLPVEILQCSNTALYRIGINIVYYHVMAMIWFWYNIHFPKAHSQDIVGLVFNMFLKMYYSFQSCFCYFMHVDVHAPYKSVGSKVTASSFHVMIVPSVFLIFHVLFLTSKSIEWHRWYSTIYFLIP